MSTQSSPRPSRRPGLYPPKRRVVAWGPMSAARHFHIDGLDCAEEVRVLKLVGATDAQIRRPFLYFGLVYGLGGGLVAAMLISIALLVIEAPLAQLLGSYGQQLALAGFDLVFLGALFASAALLGVVGALMAVRQRLAGLEIL